MLAGLGIITCFVTCVMKLLRKDVTHIMKLHGHFNTTASLCGDQLQRVACARNQA